MHIGKSVKETADSKSDVVCRDHETDLGSCHAKQIHLEVPIFNIVLIGSVNFEITE